MGVVQSRMAWRGPHPASGRFLFALKQALLFLKKKKQKDFYDSGTAIVSQATSQSHKKVTAIIP